MHYTKTALHNSHYTTFASHCIYVTLHYMIHNAKLHYMIHNATLHYMIHNATLHNMIHNVTLHNMISNATLHDMIHKATLSALTTILFCDVALTSGCSMMLSP